MKIEGSIFNMLDSFHLIDFAGALSETALGPPRACAIRIRYRFNR
jgi:hypothetical protein